MDKCPRISPLSGCEPAYDPKKWNKKIEVRETHNCYSYAMNVNDPKQVAKCKGKKECNAPFHQPGEPSKYDGFSSEKPKTCPNMIVRMLGDNPNITMATFEQKCPTGTSKIALVVDESDDYHYLRQDKGQFWSQKSGARPVTNLDADGHEIWDPQLCNLDYTSEGVLNYNYFCAYMCVPREKPLYLKSGGGLRRSLRASLRRAAAASASSRASLRRAAAASASARPFRTATTRRRS